MANENAPWTAGQDDIVRTHYGSKPLDQVAQWVGRTVQAVKKRAYVLRLQRDPAWNAKQEARLRAAWGQVPTRQLAGELGKSPNAVKLRAQRLGLDSGRYYTEAELDLVRTMYPTHDAAAIAEALGLPRRAALSVYRLAARLGLRKHPHHEPELLDQVRQLNKQGQPDREIGLQLGLSHDAVKHIRRRLGLATVPDIEGRRVAHRTQLAGLGLKNLGQMRSQAYRQFAVENGWPEYLRPREVQILNVLAAAGVPLTRLEIASRIGMKTDRVGGNGSLALLIGNGPGGTYTATLARRGLVTRLRRGATVAGRGRGKSLDLYLLGPAALAILEERKCKKQNAKPCV